MSFGQLYKDFSLRSLDLEFIYNYHSSKISKLYNDLISKFDYNVINISQKAIDTVRSANDFIEFSTRLYKIINGTAVGYSAKKINMMYIGENPDDLINLIPSYVFRDEFFPRFFSKVNYIYDNFPSDKYEFLHLLSILYPVRGLKDKIFPSYILNSNQVHNLFNRMFIPVEKDIQQSHQNKSSFLSLILNSFISYYLKYSSNYSGLIARIDPDNFISKNRIINNLVLFISNNVNIISEDMYKYIVNSIMSLTKETPRFKINIKNDIVNDVLDNDLSKSIKFDDIQTSELLYLFKELSVYYSHLVTENLLYIGTRYNSDIIDVDIIKLLDIEKYILSRFHKNFIYDLSDYIRSIQYFSIRFNTDKLFFINTIAFLHYYFISNLIYDKNTIPLTCVFDVFYDEKNLTRFIMNSIKFNDNVNIDDSIKNIMSQYLTDNIIKIIMIDHFIIPIYDYVDSNDFITFITNLVSGIYDNINEFYYYINTSFEFLEKIRMFFKMMILKHYLSSGLFDSIIYDIKNILFSIVDRISFRRDIKSMYEEFSEYSCKVVYNLLSSYSFSAVYVHYLYWTFLNPLII
ncbi:MAG: hypothetical protein QXD03_01850 [Candidatus Anstonellales archaeon]